MLSPPPATPAATSTWRATFSPPLTATAALRPDEQVDVVVVGAGYTGLWTARSLVVADPTLRVVVLERDVVGFGASGRNGGWCSALLPVSLDDLAGRHGRDGAIAMQRAMFDTVASVGEFAAESATAGLDPQFAPGGTIGLARTPRQLERVRGEVAAARRFGFGPDDVRELGAAEAADVCRAAGTLGAVLSPHCAAVHPLRLVHAIAADARRRGVRIVEGAGVIDLAPGRVVTTAATVRAPVVVLATEAFTVGLPGRRRDLLPVYSMMIGSAPLAQAVWDEIGLADRTTFTDGRRTIIYGQRTADDRLAFGGRGAPYHYGSQIRPAFDRDEAVRSQLRRTVDELFPILAGVPFEHHWGGPLGVPRDWHPHVRFDRVTGIASAGGYVGDGVATANLAGRTLADLIVGRDTDLTRLPWVGHRSRRWEPEPVRWAGVRLAALAARRADATDAACARTAGGWDRAFDLLT